MPARHSLFLIVGQHVYYYRLSKRLLLSCFLLKMLAVSRPFYHAVPLFFSQILFLLRSPYCRRNGSYLLPPLSLPPPSSFLLQVTATHQLPVALSTLALSARPWMLALASLSPSPSQPESSATSPSPSPSLSWASPAALSAASLADVDSSVSTGGRAGAGAVRAGGLPAAEAAAEAAAGVAAEAAAGVAAEAAAGVAAGSAEGRWAEFVTSGASVLCEALFVSLQGLDANDPPKALATLQLYFAVLSCVSGGVGQGARRTAKNQVALLHRASVHEWGGGEGLGEGEPLRSVAAAFHHAVIMKVSCVNGCQGDGER